MTNVVKHFKFEVRGKRRIHQTPRKGEIDACLPWLDTEIKLVRPVVWSRSARPRRRRCSARSSGSPSTAES